MSLTRLIVPAALTALFAMPLAFAAEEAAVAKVDQAREQSEEEFKVPSGYKTRDRKGVPVYCKRMTLTGSRFPKDVCLTEGELKADLALQRATAERIDQNRRVCVTATSCGGP